VLALLPAGKRLLEAWTQATEEAADAAAAGGDVRRAVTLAEALLKVARMAPERHDGPLPALALHNGEALARRVERLLDAPPAPAPARGPAARLLAAGAAIGALGAGAVLYSPLVRLTHDVAERLLALLS